MIAQLERIKILFQIMEHTMSGSGDVEAASDTAMSHQLPTTAPNVTTNPPQPPNFHPIIASMRDRDLVKMVLNIALLILAGTFFQKPTTKLGLALPIIQIMLAMGCVAIWNGIVYENTYPKAASHLAQVGISLVFLAFTALLASETPEWFMWFPVLCFVLFILPLIMAAVSREAADESQ